MSAQAVGGAVGHNSISLIIPCHRVIGADGNLTGYAGGIKTKIKLLNLEGIQLKESSPTSRRYKDKLVLVPSPISYTKTTFVHFFLSGNLS